MPLLLRAATRGWVGGGDPSASAAAHVCVHARGAAWGRRWVPNSPVHGQVVCVKGLWVGDCFDAQLSDLLVRVERKGHAHHLLREKTGRHLSPPALPRARVSYKKQPRASYQKGRETEWRPFLFFAMRAQRPTAHKNFHALLHVWYERWQPSVNRRARTELRQLGRSKEAVHYSYSAPSPHAVCHG